MLCVGSNCLVRVKRRDCDIDTVSVRVSVALAGCLLGDGLTLGLLLEYV